MSKPVNIIIWVIQVLLAVMIGGSGAPKLYAVRWPEQFATWGYPDHFVYLIGVLEIVGAVGLLIRPVMSYAGLLCATIMIGATSTHLMHAAGLGTIIFHIVLAALFVVVAFIRRPSLLRPSSSQ